MNAYSMGGSWSDDRVACCHSAVPFLIISKLKENPKISKKVINELENFGEQVDLRLLVRENMSAFCKIHKLIRNLVSDQAAEWDDLVQSSMAEFQKQSGEKLIGLYAQEIDARKNITNEFSLFDDMIKRRIYLASKNRTLTNVEKHFVTGEIKN